ncbi:alpha-L-fucosidase [Bacteroidota bacterium]
MKNQRNILISFICLIAFTSNTIGSNSSKIDPAVLEKRLEWFQDQKFGLLMALGLWSQWQIGGPWVVSNPPKRGVDKYGAYDGLDLKEEDHQKSGESAYWNYDMYRKAYWDLIKVFYPYNFDAQDWATIAEKAGAKYFIFYTKHHDGFCLYDTKLTDFKVTSPECPYSDHPNPDITARLFDAFREKGFGIGVYYSYSDWHSPYYWKPGIPISEDTRVNRHFNYDIEAEPEHWQMFVNFYQGQIRELMSGYGHVDILWLDGGWDKKYMEVDKMVEMARSYHPELIVVSRGGNIHQDIKTPEGRIPDKPLGVPWETVWLVGNKTGKDLVHILTDIVCKGGCFLIDMQNVPLSDGRLDPAVVKSLLQTGKWLEVNGEAIYGTRLYSMEHFREGNICYTKKGKYAYAIYLDESENAETEAEIPEEVLIKHVKPVAGSKVYMLGVDKPLKYSETTGGIKIDIPNSVIQSPPCKYAYSFRIQISN